MLLGSGNISKGWYADPEARIYEGKYFVYATRSAPYERQLNIDAFSSSDGNVWQKHEGIIKTEDFPGIVKAVWAPTAIEKNGKYYLVFAVNDIQSDSEHGGLEIAVSDKPEGPFERFTEKTLVDKFINGAQPIDAHLFKDDDGKIYLYYGGWGHCNVCMMNDEMDGFVPFEDGEVFREITPPDYREGPCMFKKDGKYWFSWSRGNWTDDTYGVCYCVADSPTGPFSEGEIILSTDMSVAKAPGHHGFFEDKEEWFIVYHRRPLEEDDCNSRILCIDKMNFCGEKIEKIIMT